MSPLLNRSTPHSRGSALLIVLAFLLLLTTLSVAFLTRATLERQLSNASFNQNKVDLAGQGAITSIIGDLQREIAAGSNGNGSTIVAGTNIPDLTQGGTVTGYYYPNSPLTVIPAIVGFTPASGVENLLKISYKNSAFYSGTYYNTGTYPAPNRASSIPTTTASLNYRAVSNARWNKPLLMAPINAATAVGDLSPPAAFITPDWIYVARDGSNPGANGGAWSSAYQYLSSVAPTTATSTTAGTNPVTQRYAYTIYDEGSTLDMNVAGSPNYSTGGAAPYSYGVIQPYKNALAYADVTQLPFLSTAAQTVAGASTTTLTAAQQQTFINAIVGWRNFASAGLANSNKFPNAYSFTTVPTVATAFDKNVIFNPSGFLNTGNPTVATGAVPIMAGPNKTGSVNQTDNAFTSRQQLIQFFLQGLGQNTTFTGSVPLASLESVLPYLGTFSRDINQPSYASPVSFGSSAAAPTLSNNSGTTATGGNSVSTASGYTSSVDATINPAFLSVTVGSNSGTSGWTRNDGTTATSGDPLVKKRFALMRLAWLTYNGPSANRTIPASNPGAGTANYDMWLLVNTYGIPASFLAQGTKQNIYNYFGLSWVTDPNNSGSSEWAYSHTAAYATSSASASILTSSASLSTAATIKTLTGVAGLSLALAREPDFFELIKAGLCVGSVGKSYTASTIEYSTTPSGSPADYYGRLDQDVDNQIIQVGANIISQYQPSGYPARILFNDGCLTVTPTSFTTSVIEHRGVVDLPYIYGMREAKIRTTDSLPTAYTSLPATGTPTLNGVAVAVQEPTIWNPHAWTSTSDNSDGNPRPTNFRIYAETCDPTADATGSSPSASHAISVNVGIRLNQGGVSSSDDSTAVPSTPTTPGAWTAANTAMTFSIPQSTTAASDYNYLFREPTLLITPGIPTNSLLAIDTTSTGANSTIKTLFGGTAIPSLDAATEYPTTSTLYSNKSFLGFIVGATKLPLSWKENITTVGGIDGTNPTTIPPSPGYVTYTVPANSTSISSSNAYVTYRLQYKDTAGNWITYDEKYAGISVANRYNPWGLPDNPTHGASENRWYNAEALGDEIGCVAFDPRTGRFGGMNIEGRNGNSNGALQWPPFTNLIGWAAPTGTASTATSNVYAANQNAYWAARPDENEGFNFSTYDDIDGNYYGQDSGPVAAGWYPQPPASNTRTPAAGYSKALIRPGLVSQNNMAVYSASTASTVYEYSNATSTNNTFASFTLGCFADPDGVVRRGMAAYVPPTSSIPASTAASTASAASGIPLKPAYTFSSAASAALTAGSELPSRPIMINRPFRSVADIGHVFSDTPWRNLDFSTPESGNPGFLDIFCINDTNDLNGLVAGKVNLNTRQATVLQAVLAGAYKDEFGTVPVLPGSSGTATADVIAKGLVARTTGGTNLVNIGDLVGRWSSSVTAPSGSGATSPNNIDGSQSYIGFSGTSATTSAPSNSPQNLSYLLTQDTTATGYNTNNVNRMREVAIRALANSGTTRVWNLMIDVIAQTGRFPTSASAFDQFNVEGERRYWVHVAIDRYTGKVLDEQVEEVKE